VKRVTGRADKQERGEQDLLLEVNAHVHEVATRFAGTEPEPEIWEFTCECGAADCRAPVPLTLAEYEALRAAGRSVLAHGHEKVASGDAPSTA
jgi:hypothetical protein